MLDGVIISLNFPDPELERTFRTYRNYFVSIANSLRGIYGMEPVAGAIGATRGLDSVRRIERRKGRSTSIDGALRLGWSLEVQVRLAGWLGAEVLPYMLAGALANTYYAVYHVMRATLLAAGLDVPRTHRGALNVVSDFCRRGLFPTPWGVMCISCDDDPSSFVGLPSGATFPDHQQLAEPTPEAQWTILCRLLRTTREREVQGLCDEELVRLRRRRPERKRLSPGARATFDAGITGTTLFDVFWRLRKRSHYGDVDAFVQGVLDPDDGVELHTDLLTTLGATLGVLETLLVAYQGFDVVEGASRDLLGKDRSGVASGGIGARLEHLRP
jgi:hypothetical protein